MTPPPATQALLPVTQFLPIETMQLWDVGVVTDWTNAAVSQKAEADDGEHYFAIDPEDGLEWEPTHWAPFPNSSQAPSLPGDALREALKRAAVRFEVCAAMISGGHNISGTRRAEQTIKAKHFAAEALAALTPSALSGDAGEEAFQAGFSAGFSEGMNEGMPGHKPVFCDDAWKAYVAALPPSAPEPKHPEIGMGLPPLSATPSALSGDALESAALDGMSMQIDTLRAWNERLRSALDWALPYARNQATDDEGLAAAERALAHQGAGE